MGARVDVDADACDASGGAFAGEGAFVGALAAAAAGGSVAAGVGVAVVEEETGACVDAGAVP